MLPELFLLSRSFHREFPGTHSNTRISREKFVVAPAPDRRGAPEATPEAHLRDAASIRRRYDWQGWIPAISRRLMRAQRRFRITLLHPICTAQCWRGALLYRPMRPHLSHKAEDTPPAKPRLGVLSVPLLAA